MVLIHSKKKYYIHISYLRTLGKLEYWTDFLVFNHKVEFGYSFSELMTPDQLKQRTTKKYLLVLFHWFLSRKIEATDFIVLEHKMQVELVLVQCTFIHLI